jgi:uracil phosphoribosyltransferase
MYKFAQKLLTRPVLFSSIGLGFYYMKLRFDRVNHIQCKRTDEKVLTSEGKLPEFFDEINIPEMMGKYKNLKIVNSKAVDYLIGILRDKNLNTGQFRFYSKRIIRLLIEEALAHEADEIKIKESPLGYYKAPCNPRKDSDYFALSILRSGNSMLEEVLTVLPDIYVGMVLVQRDEKSADKRPIFFFEKLPQNIEEKRVLLLDPMLATGGSATATIEILKKKGVREENIIFLNLICCPEGIDNLFTSYPKIKIITARVDKYLLPNKYIAPGIGDFGDRFYGTQGH